MSQTNDDFRDEVKKEFQLERMILFSDAVFAIVITLMAIEIRLPAQTNEHQGSSLLAAFKHLVPAIMAYAVSFLFIGIAWYRHLKLFSVLKDYDAGLVVRNLALLFFVGLFPFSATVVTHSQGSPYAMVVYLGVIFMCMLAQYVLQDYVLIRRPDLRIRTDLSEHLFALKRRKVMVIASGLCLMLITLTLAFVTSEQGKLFAIWWVFLLPLSMRLFARKRKVVVVKHAEAGKQS